MNTLKTYYQSNLIIVRDSVKDDCFQVAKYMRKQDADEAWSANHFSPIETALGCFHLSSMSYTIDRNGFAVGMFGIIPRNMVGDSAMIWMLCTEGISGIEKTVVRNSRKFVDYMLNYYPSLFSYVSVENHVSFKWLRFMGAKFGQLEPYGIEKKQCQLIYFTKGK